MVWLDVRGLVRVGLGNKMIMDWVGLGCIEVQCVGQIFFFF